jgi:hypothetical protein
MPTWLRLLLALVTVVSIALLHAATTAAADERRIALVISNTNYENVPALPNTENDARAIARLLGTLGFEVDLRSDLDNVAFREALRDFRRRADEADVSLVYYAGHGMEVDRTNYLIPVDAVLDTDRSAEFEAVPLDLVTLASAGARRFRLVILDACRNNPFLRQMARSVTSRSIGSGLAAVEPQTSDMLIAYAAREGTVAYDGSGEHSPYARALLDHLAEPGLEIGQLFREVRDQVLEVTGGAQEPFVYGSLSSREFFLNPPVAAPEPALAPIAPPPPAPDPAQARAAPPPAAAAPDDPCRYSDIHWQSALELNEIAGFEEHLLLFPNCTFASLARIKITQLTEAAAVSAASPPRAAEEPETPPAPDASGSPEVAALTPTPDAGSLLVLVPAPAAPDLAALQTELRRVGCYLGKVDGLWGRGSERALDAYIRETGAAFASREADPALLEHLKARPSRVCPLDCGPLFEVRDGACVRVACPRGRVLRADGSCAQRPAPVVRAAPSAEPDRPAAPPAAAAEAAKPDAPQAGGSKRADPRCRTRVARSAMTVFDRRRICGLE